MTTRMMTRRWSAGLAAVALVFTATSLSAHALAPEGQGWWWRAQPGLLVPVPPPPQVPENGLYVEGAPDGPSAVSALRVRVPDGSVAIGIVLNVAQEQGGQDALLLACPAGGPWIPASAGRWDARPAAACEGQGVLGQRSADGSTWTFPLNLVSFSGTKDFVFVPGKDDSRPAGLDGSVFSIAFAPPGDGTVLTEDADVRQDPPRPPVFRPPDGGGSTPTLSGGPPPSVPPAPEATPEVSDPSVITPRVTPPQRPTGAQPAPAGKDARALATLIALLSVGVAGVLSRDRLAGTPSFVTAGDEGQGEGRVGGIGRFRRPRSSPPPPL